MQDLYHQRGFQGPTFKRPWRGVRASEGRFWVLASMVVGFVRIWVAVQIGVSFGFPNSRMPYLRVEVATVLQRETAHIAPRRSAPKALHIKA